MLKMHLVLRQLSESIMELSLPLSFRIAFAVIAVILIASMISLGAISTVPFVVTCVTILAGLYEERWSFDRGERIITHRYGLLLLARKRSIPLDEVEAVILSNCLDIPVEHTFSARRSAAQRSLVSLHLAMKQDKNLTIEIRANRHNDNMKENAKRIADFCGLRLEYRE